MRLKLCIVTALGIGVVVLSTQSRATIKNTRHNLSNWGKYTIKASGTTARDTQVCIFCHAPHNADSTQAPLWNHSDTATTTFQMASSANVKPGRTSLADAQPTGISKKCLSCHDGTLAIGAIISFGGNITVAGGGAGGGNILASGDYGYVGTNLSKGHVISFDYYSATNGNSNFVAWANISTVNKKSMFDRNRKMQCHSCHDPHDDWCNDSSKTVGHDPLWRKPCDGTGKNSSVCRVCHTASYTIRTFPN